MAADAGLWPLRYQSGESGIAPSWANAVFSDARPNDAAKARKVRLQF